MFYTESCTPDSFSVVLVNHQDTGLPYTLYLDSVGVSRGGVPCLYLKIHGDWNIITISSSPQSVHSFEHSDTVFRWIAKYENILFQHWIHELSDREVIDLLGT